jgi:hypothetical protein
MEKIKKMSTKDSDTVDQNPLTLRLVWPQWQGAGVESIRELFSEVPFEEARRGYAVGAAAVRIGRNGKADPPAGLLTGNRDLPSSIFNPISVAVANRDLAIFENPDQSNRMRMSSDFSCAPEFYGLG